MATYPLMGMVRVMWHLEVLGYKRYLKNGARCSHSYNGRLTGNYVWHIEWHNYNWSWVSLKVTFVVTSDKMRHAVPLQQQSLLYTLSITFSQYSFTGHLITQPLIHNYWKSVPISHQHQTSCSEMRTQDTILCNWELCVINAYKSP